jgi:hypothetical protein
MRLFKIEKLFNKKGEEVEPSRKCVGYICDLTGRQVEFIEDIGVTFSVSYNNHDPNFGSGVGEHEFSEKWNADLYSLFGDEYHFLDDPEGYIEKEPMLTRLMRTVDESSEMDRPYLDQIFRWCRTRTADRLLTEKKYTMEELGIEKEDEY